MDILCLSKSISYSYYSYVNASYIIKFLGFKDVWIFNCSEGCQYLITHNKYKINNVSKIFVMDMHINNISGLMGLLSSLNLIGRVKSLHIYGSEDLVNYLNLCKKYSCTSFNYIIYLHILKTGLVINHYQYRVYNFQSQFIIMQSEQSGKFLLDRAQKNYLIPGPLYGKLKKGLDFVLPDGFNLNGHNFIIFNSFGSQVSFLFSNCYTRLNMESIIKSKIIFY